MPGQGSHNTEEGGKDGQTETPMVQRRVGDMARQTLVGQRRVGDMARQRLPWYRGGWKQGLG